MINTKVSGNGLGDNYRASTGWVVNGLMGGERDYRASARLKIRGSDYHDAAGHGYLDMRSDRIRGLEMGGFKE